MNEDDYRINDHNTSLQKYDPLNLLSGKSLKLTVRVKEKQRQGDEDKRRTATLTLNLLTVRIQGPT